MSFGRITERGTMEAILATAISWVALTGLLVGWRQYAFLAQKRIQFEASHVAAAAKLEDLLNAPWDSEALVAGREYREGSLAWWVTAVEGRLKRIDIRASLEHSISRSPAKEGVFLTGYKYYDF